MRGVSIRAVGICVLFAACSRDAGSSGTITVVSQLQDQLTLNTQAKLAMKRQDLINFIWGASAIPTSIAQVTTQAPTANCQIPGLTNVSFSEELRITIDDQLEVDCHFVASPANGRLVVYNPGHTGQIADGSSWTSNGSNGGAARTIQALLKDGFSVLVAYMPRDRPDQPSGCWSHGVPITCSNPIDPLTEQHVDMFVTLTPSAGSVWKYFVQGISDGINFVVANAQSRGLPQYSEFNMVGLSGGGWTTTIYAAVDPRIKTSISVSGSEPLDFWGSAPDACKATNTCDEQDRENLYLVAGYRDLYTLDAAGEGRRHIQVLNRNDSCCFNPGWNGAAPSTWQPSLRAYETAIRNNLIAIGDRGSFRLEIDDGAFPDAGTTSNHQISKNALVNVVLSELAGARRHAGAANDADAFVRGGNGNLWHFGAGAWEDTTLAMVGAPAVLLNTTHALDVFYRDSNNELRQAWKSGSSWTSQLLGGGKVLTDPAAASWGSPRFDIVAFGSDSVLRHWFPSGTDVPVSSAVGFGAPTIVSAASNRLDAFVRNLNGGVTRVFWDGSAWASENLGGGIRGTPSAAVVFEPGAPTTPVRRAYVLGMDDSLYENAKAGTGAWSGWAGILSANLLRGSPSAIVRSSDGTVAVFARTPTDRLAIFNRAPSWSFTSPGGTTFRGSPTPVSTGAGRVWGHGLPANDLQLFSTATNTWSSKGGAIE